jgi:hypothetical protein
MLRDVGSGSSPDPHVLGLNALLSRGRLGDLAFGPFLNMDFMKKKKTH